MVLTDAHYKEAAEVAAYYHVDTSQGLSEHDVIQARTKYGRNELEPEQSTPLWKLILKQFDDLLVKILLVAAVVDFVIAMSEGEGIGGALVEPMVIMLILVANATVGVVTERSAEQAIEELRAYEAESATVIREGRTRVIPSSELVPGDVVEVAVGGKVPADVRVAHVYTSTLRIDQSLLTGESVAVEKHVEPVTIEKAVVQDKTNILFSGTLVVAGRAQGIVVGTGAATAIGKIRDAMKDQPEVVTPLKQKLDEFGELLSKVIACICVLVWIININRFKDPALGGWVSGAIHYFKIAVALAVAAIPEGLPAVVTTCLALGTRRMAARHAIVRTLPSVETLGCTTVICSDKTGTLTTNQMCVVKVAVLQNGNGQLTEYEVTGTSFSKHGSVMGAGGAPLRKPADTPCLLQAAIGAALCNDSQVVWNPESGQVQRIGDPTELALRVFVEKVGLPSAVSSPFHDAADDVHSSSGNAHEFTCNAHWTGGAPRLALLEFSRDRKMMSVLVGAGAPNRAQLWVKGAPENVLHACTSALANNGEGVVPLSDSMRQAIMADMQAFGAQHALRCLALATKTVSGNPSQITPGDEAGLTFVGLLGMHDPPRLECKAAIETCRAAGIRVVMVTGDNKATAEAVGRQVGALRTWGASAATLDPQSGLSSLTGAEFDGLAAMAQSQAAGALQVFSRVEPLHKLKLVELLQAQGHVVAMTGDGVNDAPALMRADIGVAMGSGTAVAKSASDMVLADDNFATIVFAVAEGRAIFANTKQFIRYMISSNIGEVVAIFTAALLGMPEVLTPVQLLWVNLVTDGLPATALGLNKPDRDLMTQPPRRINEPIVNRWLFIRYLVVGTYVGLVTVGGFAWWFLTYPQGGNVTWYELTHFQKCNSLPGGEKLCEVFRNDHPTTIAMSVLVVVEMFNALNNLSEDASLLRVPPWDNQWLLAAIATSMALHFLILYFPPAAALFSVTPLSWAEWQAVLVLSAPVVLVDEAMKALSRRRKSGGSNGSSGASGSSSGHHVSALALAGVTVQKELGVPGKNL